MTSSLSSVVSVPSMSTTTTFEPLGSRKSRCALHEPSASSIAYTGWLVGATKPVSVRSYSPLESVCVRAIWLHAIAVVS